MNSRMKLGAFLVAVALVSCGGGDAETQELETEETSGAEASASAEGSEPTDELHFDDMSHDQQMAYMREVVMPEMATLFREYDAEEFAEFTCATCHGENAREVHFHMPNGLDPLPPSQIGAIVGSGRPMPTFMAETVLPRMAELLHEQPYDPATHEGFGCLGCHASAPE